MFYSNDKHTTEANVILHENIFMLIYVVGNVFFPCLQRYVKSYVTSNISWEMN